MRRLRGYNGGMNAKFIDFDALRTLARQIGAALIIAGVVRAFLVVDPMGEPATVVTLGIVAALAGCIQKPKGGVIHHDFSATRILHSRWDNRSPGSRLLVLRILATQARRGEAVVGGGRLPCTRSEFRRGYIP